MMTVHMFYMGISWKTMWTMRSICSYVQTSFDELFELELVQLASLGLGLSSACLALEPNSNQAYSESNPNGLSSSNIFDSPR
jgi:hypothetical protein